ncbi:hypothetical protein [Mycobacterium marinum]|nr:hypothetical protein [Mycobacterium marinum]
MDAETFNANRQAITAAVNLIMQQPESRTRFRLFAIYEAGTGELIAEVLRTSLGVVVVSQLDGEREVQPLNEATLEFTTPQGKYKLFGFDVLGCMGEGVRKVTLQPGTSILSTPLKNGKPAIQSPMAYRRHAHRDRP